MKKIVVLGATGNTGAYLVDDLCHYSEELGYQVIAAGRRETRFFDRYGIEYCQVDIADRDSLHSLPMENVHAVILLAGLLPAHMDGYSAEAYIRVNGIGALNVLEYCREVGADRILYAQTISDVLGGVTQDDPVIHPYDTRNVIMTGDHAVYALSKCLAVDLIKHYQAEFGLKGFVFRLPTVYAYKPDPTWCVDGKRKMLGYRLLMNKAMKGEPLEIWGNPTCAKDVVNVKDFCQLLRKASTCEGVDGGTFNVGTGVGTTTEEWVRGIAQVFNPVGKKSEITYRPEMPDGPSFVMDIDNCRKLLDYEPEYRFIDFLKDFKEEMSLNKFSELREAGR